MDPPQDPRTAGAFTVPPTPVALDLQMHIILSELSSSQLHRALLTLCVLLYKDCNQVSLNKIIQLRSLYQVTRPLFERCTIW